MSFSDNLKRIRTQKGITQGDLGAKIGVHPNHISRYERGDSSPSAEVLKSFAEALEVTIDELVFGDRQKNIADSIQDLELIKLIKLMDSLSDKEKETIKDLIAAYIFRNETRRKLAS